MGAKTTLVGETFPDWVGKQVEQRQLLLGKPARGEAYDTADLKYINGKTAFLRLTSGVNITNDKNPTQNASTATTRLQDLGLSDFYLGNTLARAFVLQGGTNFASGPTTPEGTNTFIKKSGIANNLGGDTLNNSAYGFASDSNFGYSPMPGIVSADIKSLNRGSLKEATVKIKCWNPRQFDIIDTLFIKLKYGVLLEWGHSIYVDNNGFVQNNNFNLSHDYLNSDNQQEIYKKIEQHREWSQGNYDAILAYVKNFNWSLNADNSYDIDLKLISIGDVIESLKTNVRVDTAKAIANEVETDDKEPNLLKRNANRTALDQFMAGIMKRMAEVGGDSFLLGDASIVTVDNITELVQGDKTGYFTTFSPEFKTHFTTDQGVKELIRLEFDEIYEDQEEAHYIKLGTLLRFIENAFVPRDPENKNTMFRVNHTFETDPNNIPEDSLDKVALCYTFPAHMSLDPSVCLIPMPENQQAIQELLVKDIIRQVKDASNGDLSEEEAAEVVNNNLDISGGWWTTTPEAERLQVKFGQAAIRTKKFNNILDRLFRRDEEGSQYIGNLNHIHVNCSFISKTLTQLINADEKGAVNIYDFLTNIMKGIQKALGGVNDFEIVYESDQNIFYIMDNTQIPNAQSLSDRISQPPTEFLINILDKEQGRGSFVKNVTISSEITSELATEISIAATSNKPSINSNSMRFGWLNYGCENRVLRAEELSNQGGSGTGAGSSPQSSTKPDYESIVDKYAQTCETYLSYVTSIAELNYNYEDKEEYTPSLSTIFNLTAQNLEKNQSSDPEKKGTQSRGFIPISLGLKVDGLSGPKIYEKIAIPNVFLPSSYKGNVYFILKGISHTIADGVWDTSYETLAVPFSSQDTPDLGINLKTPEPPPQSDPIPPLELPEEGENDDYKSLSSGLPHGRPPYGVPDYKFSAGGSGAGAGDGYKIHKLQNQSKFCIVLHHTAGHAKEGENTIITAQDWSSRADHVSTHAIIGKDGYVDILYPDDRQGNHTGAGLNAHCLGIEIGALGYCEEINGQVRTVVAQRVLEPNDGTNMGYTSAVDKFGNDISYKGYAYYQAYTQTAINATISLCKQWLLTHDIAYSYDYDVLFPSSTAGSPGGAIYNRWKSREPGIYTHNSMKGNAKWDIFPQYEMIVALRNLALDPQIINRPGSNGDVTNYPGYPDGYNNL